MSKLRVYELTYNHPLIPTLLTYIKNKHPSFVFMDDIIDCMRNNKEMNYASAAYHCTNSYYYPYYISILNPSWKDYIRTYNEGVKARHEN